MKKSEQSAETKKLILHAAAACFAEKGYSGCSMQDIACRAGISKGAIYGHFSGKAELFKTMIANEHARGSGRARKAAEQGPYIDGIIKFLGDCIRDWGFPIDHRLWVEALAVAARDPEMKKAFLTSEARARSFFRELIEKGIAAGEIDDSIDADALAILLFALGDGLIARIADDSGYDFQKNFAAFEKAVRKVLLKKEKL